MTSQDFELMAAPHLAAGFRLASGMLGGRQEAEDVVQEAVLKAWSRIGQLRDGPEGFRPWFLAIVANQARSLRRGRWWGLRTFADAPEQAVTDAGVEDADRVDLWASMARLSPDDRGVLVLRYVLDMPVDEVAGVLGISVAAAKSRLHRAALRMRPGLAVQVRA